MLLNGGELLKGNFHPHISSRHHNAVADVDDLLDIIDAEAIFDLGDQVDMLAAVLGKEAANGGHVLGHRNEGAGDKVHVVLNAEENVGLVLLAQILLFEVLAGKAHALAI